MPASAATDAVTAAPDVRPVRSRAGRALRRRHLLHHFHDDGTGYGVSAPWWDHVFRTAPPRRRKLRPS